MGKSRDLDDIMDEGADKLRERVDDVRDRVENATDLARAKGEEIWEDAVKLTRKHPTQAIGIAVLAGTILGVLLGGRRRD